MKRQSNQSDSFDLFLDTICNAFGGIVFIAILVAILVQTRSVAESLQVEVQDTAMTTLTNEELELEVERLRSKKSRLQRLLESLTFSPAAPQEEVASPITVQQDINAEIDELQPELEDDLDKLAKYTSANRQLGQAIKRLEEYTKAYETAKQAEEDSPKKNENELVTFQVPKARTTSQKTYSVLLKGDLIYHAGYASGLNENIFNGADVSVRQSADGEAFWVRPSTGSDGKPVGSPSVQSLLRRLSVRGEFLTMIVWDDSYKSFQELKNALLRQGLGYRTWIVPPGEIEMELGFTNQNATIQ